MRTIIEINDNTCMFKIIFYQKGENETPMALKDYEYKEKNYHNLVKFFIDFTENNEIVFKYAKSMKHPGPAKNYKKQDLNSRSSSNWGWLYAYASRFPDHENIQRLKRWSKNKSDLNIYQRKIVDQLENVSKRGFGSASWTVVEPYCHFTK